MSVNEPTASAFRWEITSGAATPQTYELACFANQVFTSQVGFRTVYRQGDGEWKYLVEPIIYAAQDFETQSDVILAQISKKVREYFLLDDEQPIPQTLFEQVEQLLRVKVEWNNEYITKK